MITSTSNEKIKEIKKLIKSSKQRREMGLYIVEGIRMFREIPEDMLDTVYVSESAVKKYNENGEYHFEEDEKTIITSDNVFSSMSDTGTPQGIMATVKIKEYSLDSLLDTNPFIIVVERLQDPGNMGTIIRMAEAAGATGVLISSDSVDIYNPKTIRSTMGSIFRLPIVVSDNLAEDLKRLSNEGVIIYGAHLDGGEFYDKDFTKPSAFLIGNEGNGLSDEISKLATDLIRIPMKGKVESLNAAISATVLSYEVMRQRR